MTRSFYIRSVVLLLAALELHSGANASDHPVIATLAKPSAEKSELYISASETLLRTVSRADVVTAAKVWVENFSRRRNFGVNPHLEITNVAEMKKQVLSSSTDILFLNSFEFFELAQSNMIKPVVAMSRDKTPGDRYLILVNSESGISSLEQLKGRSLNIYTRSDGNLAKAWVEVLLSGNKLDPSHFFGTASMMTKPSTACLPVFFKRVDACVVGEADFKLLSELNPQIGLKLKSILSSPPIVETVVSFHNRLKDHRDLILDAFLSFDKELDGQEILRVLKGSHSLPLTSRDLEETRDLWSKHSRLSRFIPLSQTASNDLIGGKP